MAASKQFIQETVIRMLEVGYRPPKDPDRDPLAYGELVSLLVDEIAALRLDQHDLHRGATRLAREWKYQRWPVLAELLAFFDRPVREIATQKPAREAWAETVMRSSDGQQALRDGFGRELYLWAERNPGTVPGEAVLNQCYDADIAYRASLRALIDGSTGAQTGPDVGSWTRIVALRAGGAMNGYENELKKLYLQA